ncbi:putative oxidoreductase [Actinacidiphila reveromycinica]|uniref:Putative oxidoreductase n=1 Tax=Actinacidiphila reveromycinica TaxID=659352 RepID=A0A7U3UWV9_9ACTN|nr:flavin reductase family protein [Streptomyces sp. SN-593]BBB00112.1 putative oxidoreductase [Streptomyces sp. SN-593]
MTSARVPAAPTAETDLPLANPQHFRDAMAQLASTVTIVTTTDGDGRPWGFTASSVVPVSLDPPLVMVGVAHTSSCYEALAASDAFVVNVLGDRHRDLAGRFATSGADRFTGSGFTSWPGTDLPYLPDATAAFRCLTQYALPAGDHDLLLGALADTLSPPATAPSSALLWYRRAFHTPAP